MLLIFINCLCYNKIQGNLDFKFLKNMKKLVKFFHEIGKLKKIPRKGWVLIGVKNPASIADHSFRLAIMTWILAKEKKLNVERAIKIALIHDLCELYAGDTTPYDPILPKDKKEWPKLFDKWPRFSKSKKNQNYLKKHKKERASLIKLISGLPPEIKKEILNLWFDYEKGRTKEGRFVKQVNRLETLLQAFEYGKETKRRPFHSWWVGSEERVDDPFLVKLMSEVAKKFYPKTKKKGKK